MKTQDELFFDIISKMNPNKVLELYGDKQDLLPIIEDDKGDIITWDEYASEYNKEYDKSKIEEIDIVNYQPKKVKYLCSLCDYQTNSKFKFDRHTLTKRHRKRQKIQQDKEKDE